MMLIIYCLKLRQIYERFSESSGINSEIIKRKKLENFNEKLPKRTASRATQVM